MQLLETLFHVPQMSDGSRLVLRTEFEAIFLAASFTPPRSRVEGSQEAGDRRRNIGAYQRQNLLPTPLPWPPTFKALLKMDTSFDRNEDWCLDDWFPAQKDACWVIREAEDSKPLQESFLLMPGSEESDRPVFFIALFAETEPVQLVKELAALYKVSADTALNSPETMQRLNTLYEKVRDFPLDK